MSVECRATLLPLSARRSLRGPNRHSVSYVATRRRYQTEGFPRLTDTLLAILLEQDAPPSPARFPRDPVPPANLSLVVFASPPSPESAVPLEPPSRVKLFSDPAVLLPLVVVLSDERFPVIDRIFKLAFGSRQVLSRPDTRSVEPSDQCRENETYHRGVQAFQPVVEREVVPVLVQLSARLLALDRSEIAAIERASPDDLLRREVGFEPRMVGKDKLERDGVSERFRFGYREETRSAQLPWRRKMNAH